MHNPNLIPILLNDTSINKGMIYRKLKKTLPCRIGIEFELAGNFVQKFCEEYKVIPDKKTDLRKILAQFYNVLEIRGDSDYSGIEVVADTVSDITVTNSTPSEGLSYTDGTPIRINTVNTVLAQNDVPIYEIRISLSNYKQLKGLYKFLQDLVKFCKLHEGGGIHIHIDMSAFKYANTSKEREVQYYIQRRLNDIDKFFPKYKGKYNKKIVGLRQKGTWVNLSRLDTLEFRTMPLTFDYSTLMEWIVKIVRFRQDVIHYCKLKPANEASRKERMEQVENTIYDSLDLSTTSDTNNYHSWVIHSTNRPLASSYTNV